MSDRVDDLTVRGEPNPVDSPLIRWLTIVAAALTTAGVAVNLILQIARFARKRPVRPDQRDKIQAAGLTISVLRQLPGLIKQVRLLIQQIKARGISEV
jgi:hypothetical protein